MAKRPALGPTFLLRISRSPFRERPNRPLLPAPQGRSNPAHRGIVGVVDSGSFMTETADELSTPLGQKTEPKKRRFRLPFTAMQALAVLLGLFLVAFGG